ncbi:DUF3880 domain-containing protein [Lachnospiraceae bacterium C1.1]|nr:DUF3880 domain-containing protein [Lachnospiraceae bacterium C1.1]
MSIISDIHSINIVYVGFNDMGIHNLLWGILELGLNCRVYDIEHCTSDSPEDYEKLITFVKESPTDLLISQNYSPTVSNVCDKLSIPYAAWTYDMPLTSLHHASIFNNCNFIFSFDKFQTDFLIRKGMANVYHLPLAANLTRSSLITISSEDEERFGSDLSFIGNIQHKGWDDKFNDYMKVLPENDRQHLSQIKKDTFGIWDGRNRIHESFTDTLLSDFRSHTINKPEIDEQLYYETVISYHISFLERVQMLKSLIPYNIRHYTQTAYSDLEGLNSYPSLDYESELPKAYFLTKINMSSTLRSIPSGVPLRVFDILSMCSFCLTNYQPEIDDLFEAGKDLIVYKSLDEIPSLVDYYLRHDDERLKIAANGYKKVSSCYTWAIGVEKILRTVFRLS